MLLFFVNCQNKQERNNNLVVSVSIEIVEK